MPDKAKRGPFTANFTDISMQDYPKHLMFDLYSDDKGFVIFEGKDYIESSVLPWS